MSDGLTRFGPSALVVELNNLAGSITSGESPEVLNNLPALMTQHFQLTADQQAGLTALASDASQMAQLKELVLKASSNPAGSQFVVASTPSATGLVHELRLETTVTTVTGPPETINAIRIAHCDANCGNWGWG
jgi:hypothetical protein